MDQPQDRLDLPSFLHGQEFAKLEGRVADIETWKAKLDGYADAIRSYSRRAAIVAIVWLLGLITTALPGSPLSHIAAWLGRMLQPG